MELLVLFSVIAVVFSKSAVHRDPMINENLFEGDIYGIDPDSDRNAIVDDNRRWPEGIVKYYLTPEVEEFKALIEEAMRHIEAHSCIRFAERTPEDKDYVKIFMEDGCWSHWGRIGGENLLSLGPGCQNFAVIMHELMHAIGFEHEHNRSDRDDYLIIHWENIEEKYEHNFRKLQPNQNRLLTQFDMSSIMLYGSRSFTTDPKKLTMVFKDLREIPEIYDRKAMSVLDSRRINILYKCKKDEDAESS